MPDEAHTFMADDADASEEPDIYVTETFTNSYGDERAVIDGDTYDAKETIKFDWETTHHSFDGDRNAWVVDADALDILGVKLSQAGYTFRQVPEEEIEPDDLLADLAAAASEGDHIAVTYEQKNGNGENTYEGTVQSTVVLHDAPNDGVRLHTGDGKVVFHDTAGTIKRVSRGEYGAPALFSGGYHPFMGTITEVTLTERETEAGDD
jgi:hypothetical protein